MVAELNFTEDLAAGIVVELRGPSTIITASALQKKKRLKNIFICTQTSSSLKPTACIVEKLTCVFVWLNVRILSFHL